LKDCVSITEKRATVCRQLLSGGEGKVFALQQATAFRRYLTPATTLFPSSSVNTRAASRVTEEPRNDLARRNEAKSSTKVLEDGLRQAIAIEDLVHLI
jgi:hypothetical protein